MRFQILLLKGGIYLDWDVIVLKPFTELLNSGHPMLMGEEKRVPGYQYAISNAVMMARPRSRFISQWLSELKHIFQPNCYTCHSVGHAPHVVERMPTDVKAKHVILLIILTSTLMSLWYQYCWFLLPWAAGAAMEGILLSRSPENKFIRELITDLFLLNTTNLWSCQHEYQKEVKFNIHSGWEKAPADALFGENHPIDEQLLGLNMDSSKKHFHESYAIHLFESHQNLVHHIQKLTENYVNTVDTNFNLIVRPLLQQWFAMCVAQPSIKFELRCVNYDILQ